MNFSIPKTVLLVSTILTTVAVAIAYAVAPYIGSAYMNITKVTGDDSPVLTGDVALPFLRAASLDPFASAPAPLWVNLVWLLMFAGPPLILIYAWKTETREELLARWIFGVSFYVPILVIIMLVVISGLTISIASM